LASGSEFFHNFQHKTLALLAHSVNLDLDIDLIFTNLFYLRRAVKHPGVWTDLGPGRI
jgi:hypothetical protein